jgi:HEAT repeat protein
MVVRGISADGPGRGVRAGKRGLIACRRGPTARCERARRRGAHQGTLGDEDFDVREAALIELAEIGEPAEPFLQNALQDPDEEVRTRVALLTPVKVRRLMRKVSFSNSMMRVFPNLYELLATSTPAQKLELLQKITEEYENGGFKHEREVTDGDMLVLIGELLVNGGGGLDARQKVVVMWTARGMHCSWQGKLDPGVRLELGQSGWSHKIPGSGRHIAGLLRDEDPAVRCQAVKAMMDLGCKDQIRTLVDLLGDSDTDVRYWTLNALRLFGDRGTVREIAGRLSDADAFVRVEAAVTLRCLDATEASAELIKALGDGSPKVRTAVIEALSDLKIRDAAAELGKIATTDPDSGVRISAIEALGKIGANEVVPTLLGLLDDANAHIRSSAVCALGRLVASEQLPRLLQLVSDPSGEVRGSVASVLGQFRANGAVGELERLLDDNYDFARGEALWALGRLAGVEVPSAFGEELKDSSQSVPADVAKVLEEFNLKGIPAKVVQLLQDENSAIRRSAAFLLAGIGARESIEPLTETLKKEGWQDVRMEIILSLAKPGAKEAMPDIAAFLTDSDAETRGSAAIALSEMGARDKVSDGSKEDIEHVMVNWKWRPDYRDRAKAELKGLGVTDEEIEGLLRYCEHYGGPSQNESDNNCGE